jgi:hypothetical protein
LTQNAAQQTEVGEMQARLKHEVHSARALYTEEMLEAIGQW